MYVALAAEDRLSFHQIAQSNFIKDSKREKKLIAHSTPTTIRRKVAQLHELYGERWPSFTNLQKLMSCKTTSIKLSKANHKRLEEQPETVEHDPVPLAKELAYLLTLPPPLVDIIEPEGLNGDDQNKAQDVQIEAIYLKKYDFIIN